MPKRFTDTDKWKKPFIRSLEAPYKLLWFYILDDCDHAGIWQVDFEVAQIRTGQTISEKTALQIFGEKIESFDDGTKWFIKDFIFFQYGELNPKNRLHLSVINILTKHKVGAYKVLTRTQGQGQGQGQGKGQGQGQGQGKLEIFESIFTDELFLADLSRTHKGKNLEQAFEECWLYHIQKPSPPEEVWEWKQKLTTWLTIKKHDNGTPKKSGKETPEDLAKAFAERRMRDSNGQ